MYATFVGPVLPCCQRCPHELANVVMRAENCCACNYCGIICEAHTETFSAACLPAVTLSTCLYVHLLKTPPESGSARAAGVIGGLLSFVVINGINAALDQLLEAVGYVPKLIHRASSVCALPPLTSVTLQTRLPRQQRMQVPTKAATSCTVVLHML